MLSEVTEQRDEYKLTLDSLNNQKDRIYNGNKDLSIL